MFIYYAVIQTIIVDMYLARTIYGFLLVLVGSSFTP